MDLSKISPEQLVREIKDISPYIEEIGYINRELRIGIGFPPSLDIFFEKTKDIDEAGAKEMIEKHKDKKLLGLVVNALLSANSVQEKIDDIGEQKFKEVRLTLSLPPRITLRYMRE